jgi:hypothetical protein
MNQKISEKTPRRKALRKKVQTIKLLTRDLELFIKWLRYKGVNISEFTRELWRITPEFEDFKTIKDKRWLEKDESF